MNNQELWQRYQDWLYFNNDLGLYLDISRMRFDNELVNTLTPKFTKAYKDIEALENGAIANPDENRMVGHYWLRNPDLAPVEIKKEIIDNIEQIEDFVQKVHDGRIHPISAPKFTDILSIGIGGSALGPQFVNDALAPLSSALSIHFIDNTDPAGIDKILDQINDRLKSTLVIITSKSGGTPETRNGMLEVKEAFKQQGLSFSDHAVAVTMLGSKMDEIERNEGWLAEFPMFDWVGGRTSEMSSVGLLSASLMGIEVNELLLGAKTMDNATRIPDIKQNPAALLALTWYYASNGKGEKDLVILPYKDSLQLFSKYLQQLVMESLGKEVDLEGNIVHQGLTVYGNKGSTDQHAFVQQLREGVANFFTLFIEVLKDRKGPSIEVDVDTTTGDYLSGMMLGTRQALYDNNRDSITLTLTEITPKTIGALIALFERTVGIYASLININAYNQPGVEAGKIAAEKLLVLQRRIINALKISKKPISLSELSEKLDASDQIEQVYKIVRHLAENQRGIVLQGDLNKPITLEISYQFEG